MNNNSSKHKLAFLTWIVIYPLITGILFLFKDELLAIPLIARTLVLTVVLVSAMHYIIMPYVTKKFEHWITNNKNSLQKKKK